MTITITQDGNLWNAAIQGRLDTNTSGKAQEELAPLMNVHDGEIAVDCSELEYTSSQGLRLFLMLQKNAMANGNTLVLNNMRPQVKEVFDITGFSNIIKITVL